MIRDALIGTGLAAFLFCLAYGYDVTPIILAGGLYAAFQLLMSGRVGDRKFEIVQETQSGNRISRLTFGDVGGQETAKRELVEALEFINNEEKAVKLGIRPLRGILLSGPSGNRQDASCEGCCQLHRCSIHICSRIRFHRDVCRRRSKEDP